MVKACFPGGDVGDLFVVKICLLESDNDDDDCGDEVACWWHQEVADTPWVAKLW